MGQPGPRWIHCPRYCSCLPLFADFRASWAASAWDLCPLLLPPFGEDTVLWSTPSILSEFALRLIDAKREWWLRIFLLIIYVWWMFKQIQTPLYLSSTSGGLWAFARDCPGDRRVHESRYFVNKETDQSPIRLGEFSLGIERDFKLKKFFASWLNYPKYKNREKLNLNGSKTFMRRIG